MKTIFIIITRSFIVRNILRSGTLEELERAGCRVVIFINTLKGKEIPKYLIEEFKNDNVIFEKIDSPTVDGFTSRVYQIFVRWTSLLVYSPSTWSYIRAGNLNNRKRLFFWKYVEKFIFSTLAKFDWLKIATRWLEKYVFTSSIYSKYFDKYRPDIVFSTSIIASVDVAFMKEASRRGIKTVGMTKGWDHASRVLYRFIPDKIIIQNFTMKEYLIKYQRIRSSIIEVCGFPQFDWYTRKDLLLSRKDFFKLIGLNPEKRLIFFGSEGAWSPNDDKTVEILAKFVNTPGVLSQPAGLLVRPHFSDIKTNRYDRFCNSDDVKIDKHVTYTDALPCNWDPGFNEIKYFVNLLHHCDVLVNIASTLTLDACCFNKPIVSVAFGVLYNLRDKKDVTGIYYDMDHYQDVIKTGGVDVVASEGQLLDSINNYLVRPGDKSTERKVLLDKLCFKVDGQSAKRVADAVLSTI
jgi:hypothetical protein